MAQRRSSSIAIRSGRSRTSAAIKLYAAARVSGVLQRGCSAALSLDGGSESVPPFTYANSEFLLTDVPVKSPKQ